jgi:hypothetical protein
MLMFIRFVFDTHRIIVIRVVHLRTNGWGIWVVRLGMRARDARPYGGWVRRRRRDPPIAIYSMQLRLK